MGSTKSFPESRVLSADLLAQQIIESNNNGSRFCFILGSGASVESGIRSGNELEMRWMDCIMGVADDYNTPKKNPDDMRILGQKLYNNNLIKNSFEKIEKAWKNAKDTGNNIPSEYYFDIYKLRFYPNPSNGYKYLERIMENSSPSVGYHTLALLLTQNNLNNLVITTNFDSLVEDALFIFTEKKPLPVGHESLAGFIDSNIQRPIVAKVHRGLFFEPFNTPEKTAQLSREWEEALHHAFHNYTPIVIGYGGGDESLMRFLEKPTTRMRHGIYWCYRGENLPENRIKKLVLGKDGYFVQIKGFDSLMLEIGKQMYLDTIMPSATEKLLENQFRNRIETYNQQWMKLEKNPELMKVMEPLSNAEKASEKKREETNTLTITDYIRRADRAGSSGNYDLAVMELTNAINKNPKSALLYYNRGYYYDCLEKYSEAIEDYNRAIELRPTYADAYNNRGYAFDSLGKLEEAIADYTKAIELKPNYAEAHNNRGYTLDKQEKYESAISEYTKAIKLKPSDPHTYINRGSTFENKGEPYKALDDYTKAIELDPESAKAHYKRGCTFVGLGKNKEAITDFKKAIELDNSFAKPHRYLGNIYNRMGQRNEAINELSKAIELDINYKAAYKERAKIYRIIGKDDLASEDEQMAETIPD